MLIRWLEFNLEALLQPGSPPVLLYRRCECARRPASCLNRATQTQECGSEPPSVRLPSSASRTGPPRPGPDAPPVGKTTRAAGPTAAPLAWCSARRARRRCHHLHAGSRPLHARSFSGLTRRPTASWVRRATSSEAVSASALDRARCLAVVPERRPRSRWRRCLLPSARTRRQSSGSFPCGRGHARPSGRPQPAFSR